MKKVTVVSYVEKPGVARIALRLVDWLKERNIDIAMPEEDAGKLGLPDYGVDAEELFRESDVVVTLGGDGTTLRAVRLMGERIVPVVGVNLGEMGFLMWVMPDRLEEALERIHAGAFRIEERHMLRVGIKLADGRRIERLALNDVLIGREEFGRLIKLDILINGAMFCRYSADGVVVATPTGSTAYSFSAGGPVISPTTEACVLTPICPHSLNNRSLVFSANDSLKVKPVAQGSKAGVGVSVDGIAIEALADIEEIELDLADQRFKFVSVNGPGFYQALGEKLKKWLNLT